MRRQNMTEQERALLELQELAFAIHEAALYLDAYPQNTVALRYHKKMTDDYTARRSAYESRWGSFTSMTSPEGMTEWHWVKTPWPWEMAYPGGSDNPTDNGMMGEVK